VHAYGASFDPSLEDGRRVFDGDLPDFEAEGDPEEALPEYESVPFPSDAKRIARMHRDHAELGSKCKVCQYADDGMARGDNGILEEINEMYDTQRGRVRKEDMYANIATCWNEKILPHVLECTHAPKWSRQDVRHHFERRHKRGPVEDVDLTIDWITRVMRYLEREGVFEAEKGGVAKPRLNVRNFTAWKDLATLRMRHYEIRQRMNANVRPPPRR
jgi:hypothetical protein